MAPVSPLAPHGATTRIGKSGSGHFPRQPKIPGRDQEVGDSSPPASSHAHQAPAGVPPRQTESLRHERARLRNVDRSRDRERAVVKRQLFHPPFAYGGQRMGFFSKIAWFRLTRSFCPNADQYRSPHLPKRRFGAARPFTGGIGCCRQLSPSAEDRSFTFLRATRASSLCSQSTP